MYTLKTAKSKDQFQKEAKDYVVNMLSYSYVLHIKNGCKDSKCIFKYYDFDTLEEAKKSKIEFRLCKNCFKECL